MFPKFADSQIRHLLKFSTFFIIFTETPQIRRFLHAYAFSTLYFYIKNK